MPTPEMILDEITEVTMEIQNGTNNVNFDVSSENPTVTMSSPETVIVRTLNDYSRLINKPKINNRILNAGENSLPYLGVNTASTYDIDMIFYRGG